MPEDRREQRPTLRLPGQLAPADERRARRVSECLQSIGELLAAKLDVVIEFAFRLREPQRDELDEICGGEVEELEEDEHTEGTGTKT